MGSVFISRRGGSSTAFAYICVEYPAGSTCTCSDGVRVIRAKGTSGKYVFGVPYAATWIIKIHDGIHSDKTKNVSITSQYQVENVTLYYSLILYDSETGWDTTYAAFETRSSKRTNSSGEYGTPTVSYSGPNQTGIMTIAASTTDYTGGLFINTLPIDVTQYSRIEILGTFSPGTAGYTYVYLHTKSDPSYTIDSVSSQFSYINTSTPKTNASLDISGDSGNKWLSIDACRNTTAAKITISHIEFFV